MSENVDPLNLWNLSSFRCQNPWKELRYPSFLRTRPTWERLIQKSQPLGHCTDKLNCRVAANGDTQSRRRWSKVPSSTGQKLVTLFTLLTVGSLLTRTKVITNGRQNLTVILQCSWCWHALKMNSRTHLSIYIYTIYIYIYIFVSSILGLLNMNMKHLGNSICFCSKGRAALLLLRIHPRRWGRRVASCKMPQGHQPSERLRKSPSVVDMEESIYYPLTNKGIIELWNYGFIVHELWNYGMMEWWIWVVDMFINYVLILDSSIICWTPKSCWASPYCGAQPHVAIPCPGSCEVHMCENCKTQKKKKKTILIKRSPLDS